jgi:hypothetical protein
MDMVRPDYEGASVAGLVPALLGYNDGAWLPACVEGASAVVLLVLDGLGWDAVQNHAGRLPVVSSLGGGPITTVVPSTTSAALPSITTGMPPAEHGLVGYRMRLPRGILNVLKWELDDGRKGPPPATVAPAQAFCGLSVPVVTREDFLGGGFTDAFMRGSRFYGWRMPSSIAVTVRQLVEAGERFVFAYYNGVDFVAHKYGLRDEFYPAELAYADTLVGDLIDALPPQATLLVTSDHGQVHLGDQLPLDPIASLIEACAGEPRFRSLHARAGAARELIDAAAQTFGHQAWVLSRQQLVDEGWLGPKAPGKAVLRRLGDVTLAARDPIGFADPAHKGEWTMRSGHGSTTPAEMLVPLVAGRGSGRHRGGA